jgi:hypothetical protein
MNTPPRSVRFILPLLCGVAMLDSRMKTGKTMSRKILLLASTTLVLLQMAAIPQRVSAAVTAGIFCNGDRGNNMGSPTDASGLTTSQINGFRASGMTTMILFQMSVLTSGDFVYDGQTICSGGSYTGASDWGSLLSQCKVAPSGINRIEICLGGAGDTSWTNIKNLIAANGTNSSTVLYRNLSALKSALGINAIDSDDEQTYDSASAIKFGQMCAAVGLHLTLCPYQNSGYWHAVQSALGSSICDRVYLQCYEGGAGNDPANWASSLGVPVSQILPGYWDNERNTTFLTNMLAWNKEGCTGGWLWPTCGQCTPPAGPGEMLQYAGWILESFEPGDGIYTIINLNSGLVADVKHAETTNGTPVQQYTYNGGANQQWGVTNVGGGVYKIIGVQSGLALDVVGGGTANGTLIDIWPYNSSYANQQWSFTPTSGGYYRLTPQNATGSALDVQHSGTTNGTPLEIWTYGGANSQQWLLQAP